MKAQRQGSAQALSTTTERQLIVVPSGASLTAGPGLARWSNRPTSTPRQREGGIRSSAASTSSTTARSSRYCSPKGTIRLAVPRPGCRPSLENGEPQAFKPAPGSTEVLDENDRLHEPVGHDQILPRSRFRVLRYAELSDIWPGRG